MKLHHTVAAVLAGMTGLAPLSAPANSAVATDSAVFVERTQWQDGAAVHRLEQAARLTRGDHVVTVVRWYRFAGAGAFTVTNMLPAGLIFHATADDTAEVSVDGGHNWGQLGSLRRGGQVATPENVTHVRWRVSAAQAMAGAGRIAYSGFVR